MTCVVSNSLWYFAPIGSWILSYKCNFMRLQFWDEKNKKGTWNISIIFEPVPCNAKFKHHKSTVSFCSILSVSEGWTRTRVIHTLHILFEKLNFNENCCNSILKLQSFSSTTQRAVVNWIAVWKKVFDIIQSNWSNSKADFICC